MRLRDVFKCDSSRLMCSTGLIVRIDLPLIHFKGLFKFFAYSLAGFPGERRRVPPVGIFLPAYLAHDGKLPGKVGTATAHKHVEADEHSVMKGRGAVQSVGYLFGYALAIEHPVLHCDLLLHVVE